MSESPSALRLVLAYAALSVLLILVVLLPGNPSFDSTSGLMEAVVVQGLIVWRLAHGSSVAWVFGIIFAVLPVVFALVQGPPFSVGEIVFMVGCLAQAGVLAALDLRGHVGSRRSAPPAAA